MKSKASFTHSGYYMLHFDEFLKVNFRTQFHTWYGATFYSIYSYCSLTVVDTALQCSALLCLQNGCVNQKFKSCAATVSAGAQNSPFTYLTVSAGAQNSPFTYLRGLVSINFDL